MTEFNPRDYNPRYLRYAANHGRGPIEQSAHDEVAWPGGRAVGFMLWIGAAWQAFDLANGIRGDAGSRQLKRYGVARRAGFADDHAMFDKFLVTYNGQFDATGKVVIETRDPLPGAPR